MFLRSSILTDPGVAYQFKWYTTHGACVVTAETRMLFDGSFSRDENAEGLAAL